MMRLFSLILIVIFFAACGGAPDEESVATVAPPQEVSETPTVSTEQSTSYEVAYADALAAIQRATAKGHAWTTSDQLIIDAAEAAQNGDSALAISLADEARIHADLASIQADREALAWRDHVITQ